jgi:hypothetical protein
MEAPGHEGEKADESYHGLVAAARLASHPCTKVQDL